MTQSCSPPGSLNQTAVESETRHYVHLRAPFNTPCFGEVAPATAAWYNTFAATRKASHHPPE